MRGGDGGTLAVRRCLIGCANLRLGVAQSGGLFRIEPPAVGHHAGAHRSVGNAKLIPVKHAVRADVPVGHHIVTGTQYAIERSSSTLSCSRVSDFNIRSISSSTTGSLMPARFRSGRIRCCLAPVFKLLVPGVSL